MVVSQREDAIFAFNQRGAALDPITAVIICDVVEFPNGCAMNVAAEHGVYVVTFRIMRHRSCEFSDKTHRILHTPLGVSAERPITETEPAPAELDEWIQRHH